MNNAMIFNICFNNVKKLISEENTSGKKFLDYSLKIGSFNLPKNGAELEAFQKNCLSAIKTKAKMLGKHKEFKSLSHTSLLDLASNICFFESWNSCVQAVNAISSTPISHLVTNTDVEKLSISLWTPNKDDADHFVYQYVLSSSELLFEKVFAIQIQRAHEILSQVFGSDKVYDKSYIPESYFKLIVQDYFGFDERYLLTQMLSFVPLKNNVRSSWRDLPSLKISELMESPLAQADNDAGFGHNGTAHAAALVLGFVHDYTNLAPSTIGALSTDMRSEMEQLRESSMQPFSISQAKSYVSKLFAPHLNNTVLEVLSAQENEDGFFYNYTQSAQEIREDYLKYEGEKSIREYQREIKPGVFLSIYRTRQNLEEHSTISYSVLTNLHNTEGKLLATCAATLIINNGIDLYNLGVAGDEIGEEAVMEGILSIALSEESNAYCYEKVAILEHWEVSKEFRGNGLGRLVFDSTFGLGLKGISKPELVIAKLDSYKFPIPLTTDSPKNLIPEVRQEKETLNTIFKSVTSNFTSFGGNNAAFFAASYQKICNGGLNYRNLYLQYFVTAAGY